MAGKKGRSGRKQGKAATVVTTVRMPVGLRKRIDAFRSGQDVAPSMIQVIRVALDEFLDKHGYPPIEG